MSDHFIYGLIDPRTLLVRYVGKSERGRVRFTEHRNGKSGSYCKNWINELKRSKLMFETVVLEEAAADTIIDLEIWWISYARALGWPITNLTAGGNGARGYKHSSATKTRISESLKRSPSAKLSLAKAQVARDIWIAENKHLLSKRMSGVNNPMYNKTHSDAVKQQVSKRFKGKPKSVEQRKKQSEAAKRRWSDPSARRVQSERLKGKNHQ